MSTPSRRPRWLGATLALAASMLAAQPTTAQNASAELEDLVLATIGDACEASSVHELEVRAEALPGVRATRGWVRYGGHEVTGWRIELTLDDGRLIVSGVGRVGRPRDLTAEYEDAARRPSDAVGRGQRPLCHPDRATPPL